jgi:hypothetical protein
MKDGDPCRALVPILSMEENYFDLGSDYAQSVELLLAAQIIADSYWTRRFPFAQRTA